MVGPKSKLAQQLIDALRNVTTIRHSLPKYCFKLSFDIKLEFQEFSRRLLKTALDNVQSRLQEVEGSVKEVLVCFEQIFQTLISQLDK